MGKEDRIIDVLYHYQSELSDGFSYYTDGDTLMNFAKDVMKIFEEEEER